MRRSMAENMNPGPGSYNLMEYTGKEGRHLSMHSLTKTNFTNNPTPGPGNYDGDVLKLKVRQPAFKISTSKRFKK
jgi:hypothetical protein